jgi:diaminopimelate decarboxylase
MKKTERVRQVVPGVVSESEIKEQAEKGWKLVALEWEREIEAEEEKLPVEVPFGLRVSPDTQRLEEDPDAQELNRRGFRTREGEKWTPISVFEMLPRLIEVGPHLFRSAEWDRRRQPVAR